MADDGIGADRFGPAGDAFYENLMAAHEGLSLDQSAQLNARLVLILANQVGDQTLLAEAISAARNHITNRNQTQEPQEQ